MRVKTTSWKLFMTLLLALALFFALFTGRTWARYSEVHSLRAEARVASFDVRIEAPEGMLHDEEREAGHSNEILFENPGESGDYHFVVKNYGDVTVRCTVSAEGEAMPTCSFSPAGFTLAPGEEQTVTLTLTACEDISQETLEQLGLCFFTEQVD